jgi:N12 class adenine-specific DNA methylase
MAIEQNRMNIKNRLKKLQNWIIKDKFEFRECFESEFNAIVEKVYSGETILLTGVSTDAELLKNFCDSCKKPVKASTQEFCRNLQIIYG